MIGIAAVIVLAALAVLVLDGLGVLAGHRRRPTPRAPVDPDPAPVSPDGLDDERRRDE